MGFNKTGLKDDFRTGFENIPTNKTAEDAAVEMSDAIDDNFTDESPSSEDWIEIGSGGDAPDFENSWENFGGSFNTAAFYKDPMGLVHIKGFLKSGTTSQVAFTLPTGNRPAARIVFVSIGNSLLARVDILSDGGVQINMGSAVWTSIDLPPFRAEA